MPRQTGFTLIEITFVLVLIAVLAGIALPSYQHVVRKSRRADAQAMLLQMQLLQEKWRANHAGYSDDPHAIGAPGDGIGSARHYRFAVSDAGTSRYTLQATARSSDSQARDRQHGVSCASLRVDQSGAKAPRACW